MPYNSRLINNTRRGSQKARLLSAFGFSGRVNFSFFCLFLILWVRHRQIFRRLKANVWWLVLSLSLSCVDRRQLSTVRRTWYHVWWLVLSLSLSCVDRRQISTVSRTWYLDSAVRRLPVNCASSATNLCPSSAAKHANVRLFLFCFLECIAWLREVTSQLSVAILWVNVAQRTCGI